MKDSDHCALSGEGARKFAEEKKFPICYDIEELITQRARKKKLPFDVNLTYAVGGMPVKDEGGDINDTASAGEGTDSHNKVAVVVGKDSDDKVAAVVGEDRGDTASAVVREQSGDTVAAVARDIYGHLACAVSTGVSASGTG